MGYTHYWRQRRDFRKKEWEQVREDVAAILKDIEHNQGVPLANGDGEGGTSPEIGPDFIAFNGAGDDSYETFIIYRKRPPLGFGEAPSRRGWDFCKTERKPYDFAVTACLSYLATVEPKVYFVESDGHGKDWLDGVEEARRALPRYANILDIPMPIMESDRWCSPWVRMHTTLYEVHFCLDGHGYVIDVAADASRRFATHADLAAWLEKTKTQSSRSRPRRTEFGWTPYAEPNIWDATGSFDAARKKDLARLQNAACRALFDGEMPRGATTDGPPAYARPDQFPPRESAPYYYQDLLKEEV